MDLPLSERTKSVLGLARGEAIHLQHGYLGTEHLLLGILCESEGIAAEVLRACGVTLARVRADVKELIGMGPEGVSLDHYPITDKARRAMTFAAEEATRHGSPQVEPEHLLLGILRLGGAFQGHGVAANVLVNLGVSLERLQDQLLAQSRRGDA